MDRSTPHPPGPDGATPGARLPLDELVAGLRNPEAVASTDRPDLWSEPAAGDPPPFSPEWSRRQAAKEQEMAATAAQAARRAADTARTGVEQAYMQAEQREARETIGVNDFRPGDPVWVLRNSGNMDLYGWRVVGPHPEHPDHVLVAMPELDARNRPTGHTLERTVTPAQLADWQPRFHPGMVVPQLPTYEGFEPYSVVSAEPTAVVLMSGRIGGSIEEAVAKHRASPAALYELMHPQSSAAGQPREKLHHRVRRAFKRLSGR